MKKTMESQKKNIRITNTETKSLCEKKKKKNKQDFKVFPFLKS